MRAQLVRDIFKWAVSRSGTGKVLLRCFTLRFYLDEVGWFKSVERGMPVDREGSPLPWFTYSAISFLGNRLRPDMKVFEYGSGHSTLWWSSRVSSVVAYEHDALWFERLKPRVPPNVKHVFCKLEPNGDYCRGVLRERTRFDVIVIDGRDRVNCARNVAEAIADDGVVIWDNSDREKYKEGFDILAAHGFKRIDFDGFGPINTRPWRTSIFYRDSNCLGI